MGKIITVDFRQDTLFAVERDDGVFVAIKPICDAMGLVWRAQWKRLQEDAIFSEGITVAVMPSVGGAQETTLLKLELVNGWLLSIDDKRIPDPTVRDRVLTYKRECYGVLFHHFYSRAARPPAGFPASPRRFDGRSVTPAVRWAYDQAMAPRLQPDLGGVAALVALMGEARRAGVVYTFTTTSFAYVGPFPGPRQTGLPLQATVVLTNDTVRSGSFQLVGSFNQPNFPQTSPLFSTVSGGFVSVDIQGVTARPNYLSGAINLSLAFDNAGQITSSRIQGFTFSDEFAVSGPGFNVSGFLGSDDPRCNAGSSQQVCAVSGYFSEAGFVPNTQPVPEPASVALLSLVASAACLGRVRRRAA